MKFQAKLSGLLAGLQPAIVTATTGGVRDYDDLFKIALTSKDGELFAEANNGNTAISNSIASLGGIDFKPITDGTVTVKAADFAAMLGGFGSDENLTLEVVGNELIVSLDSDPEQKSSMPSDASNIVMPAKSSSYDKEVEIKREALLHGMDRVLFAVGDEKHRAHLMHWVMRIRNDGFRLAAGDGARFSVYDIEGTNVVRSQIENPFNVLVSKDHNAVFQKLLNSGSTDMVMIREFAQGNAQIPNQIVINFDNITMTLIGHDPGTKWPDENKFVERANAVKYTTAIADWEQALKSVNATYNEDVRKQNQVHNCVLNFDTAKGAVVVKADHFMKTTRKVKMLDSWADVTPSEDTLFSCLSRYMTDVQKHADAQDRIQLEFIDSKNPVVIRYFAGDKVASSPFYKTDATLQTREQFVIFIASYSGNKAAAAK